MAGNDNDLIINNVYHRYYKRQQKSMNIKLPLINMRTSENNLLNH